MKTGVITRWHSSRGYGFIRPDDPTAGPLFAHISEFTGAGPTPGTGVKVAYRHGVDSQGRTQAVNIAITGSEQSPSTLSGTLAAGTTAFAIVGLLTWYGVVSSLLLYGIAGLSFLSFVLYGIDKQAARSRLWRIPENQLHVIALLGGWPGALLAQSFFNHKTRKRSFQGLFLLCVLINVIALAFLLTTDRLS